MTELAELDKRVTKLELQMADVHKLASGASKDVGDVQALQRAHTKSIEALQESMVERFAKVDERFAKVDERFDKLEADLRAEIRNGDDSLRAEMREGFSKVGVGMAQITALLNIAIGQSGDEP